MKKGALIIAIMFLLGFSPAYACVGPATNLVSNPHFNAGNTGFTSTLPYAQNCLPGYYYVGTSMNSKCTIWPVTFVDHTTGTGNFLIVDGSDSYAPQDVWIESVPVVANHAYIFSFWAQNLYTQYPFPLGFIINGTQTATSANIAQGSWNLYSTSWTAMVTGSITIAIRQLTPLPWRDFGIDDVYFGECDEADPVAAYENNSAVFTLFPNPASSTINLLNQELAIQPYFICNITGQLIQEGITSGNKTILNIAEISPGIYFLHVGEGEKIQTLKFVKTE